MGSARGRFNCSVEKTHEDGRVLQVSSEDKAARSCGFPDCPDIACHVRDALGVLSEHLGLPKCLSPQEKVARICRESCAAVLWSSPVLLSAGAVAKGDRGRPEDTPCIFWRNRGSDEDGAAYLAKSGYRVFLVTKDTDSMTCVLQPTVGRTKQNASLANI